ncbi:YaiO family outer membrane beta-barrel protein [Robiginitalea sp. IMCC44478]|uniref:YaiO family outer membrane beta-barrel protein n=1 Tax=Robiginitalea sp. IMCC44478 TaxID=3459122 RepID=UPI0040430169
MKGIKTILIALAVLVNLQASAQQGDYDPDRALKYAQGLAFEGHYSKARDTLNRVLSDYPDYADIENLLAKTYSWEGQFDLARRHFNRLTSRVRMQEDIWVAAVKNELYAGNTSIALGLANKALLYLGSSKEVENIREDLLSDSSEYSESPVVQDSLQTKNEGYQNWITVMSAAEVFDEFYDPMLYGGLEYQGITAYGKIIPRINYSNRFGENGLQYEVDLYPKFSKTFYAYLNYGFSEAGIYPNHRAGMELYANLPNALEVSLGVRYLDFRETQARLITGSFGIYRGNYYLSLRPFVTLTDARDPGFSGSFLARKYLKDSMHFLSIRGSYGFSPELRQLRSGGTLLAETVLYVESQQLLFEYQFHGKSSKQAYRAELGLSRQEYIFDSGSFFWVFRAGFNFLLGF